MKPFWVRPVFLCVLTAILGGSGCGYRVASKNRLIADYGSIAIQPLANETTTYEVEQILTRSLVNEFVQRSNLSILNDPDRADLVMEGTINRVTVSPITVGRTGFASTFQVVITVQLQLKARESGDTVFRENSLLFRDQYVINVDVKQFFSEQNPALERIAGDFASTVVTTILEDF